MTKTTEHVNQLYFSLRLYNLPAALREKGRAFKKIRETTKAFASKIGREREQRRLDR